ncbi:DUF1471 family periplasmic protein YahO [Rahnella bonaserana]|jgi:uncharacterized protein YbjQ (UPF0145 family)|uniref:DUF1471 domain-containing protein n=1 Tax=Rahnella bonaserana TaxID=2816248 RepID=A0ABS6LVB5_9GAMM|nr:DUF1471 family periplasmic protein YahO [Rahnella bonaserana]MBU9855979.1 DUF1471 domain-containing protein [Rahnella bonaserana]MCL9641345.1 DUF1471 family periplasmic protein YahO [Rahnella victoriana]WHZ38809.1 DUF1471 family periplasmic protein YahO [Rahnella bonaserana]
MKKISVVIAVALAGLISSSAFSAQLMKKSEFKKVESQYTKIGTVSTSNKTSQSGALEDLSKKADKKGGDVIVLTSGNTNNKIHGNADVYKKK